MPPSSLSAKFSQRGNGGGQVAAFGLILGALLTAFGGGYFLGISHEQEKEEEEQRKQQSAAKSKQDAEKHHEQDWRLILGVVLCVVVLVFSMWAFHRGWFNNVEAPIVASQTKLPPDWGTELDPLWKSE